jgi:hypothetical protein
VSNVFQQFVHGIHIHAALRLFYISHRTTSHLLSFKQIVAFGAHLKKGQAALVISRLHPFPSRNHRLFDLRKLMVDSNLPQPRAQQSNRGMATGEMTLPLLTAFQRLLDRSATE